MISETSMADVYTDFQGLMRLKTEAGKQTPEAIQETARQFEALFVQTMLKAMRDASPGEGMGESDQTDFYRDMYDQQMALHMVKGRGLGLAKMLVSSMGGGQAGTETETDSLTAVNGIANVHQPVIRNVSVRPLITESATGPIIQLTGDVPEQSLLNTSAVSGRQDPDQGTGRADWHPESPEEFIHDLLPHARKGAAKLGVDPGVLIAQAALETGWGQKVIRHADGRSSYSLFGIKADSGWSGDKVNVATLEYENGYATKQRASFRSYDSIESAITGYVDFIRSNPRYQQALSQASDPQDYLTELKAAGYATDPDYVEKIRAIMDRDSLEDDAGQSGPSWLSRL